MGMVKILTRWILDLSSYETVTADSILDLSSYELQSADSILDLSSYELQSADRSSWFDKSRTITWRCQFCRQRSRLRGL